MLLTSTAVASAAPGAPATASAQGGVVARNRGLANPAASLHPSNAFKTYCYEANHVASCDKAALADIDMARAKEGLGKVHLPRGFYSMSTRNQLAAITNCERNARGLASLAVNTTLDADAQAGATAGDDPSGPSNYSWGSNISWGYVTPLAADFAWMYDDGPNSPNVDCKKAGDAGCWGHRDNILARWRGKQGDGSYDNRGTMQLTQLFVENY